MLRRLLSLAALAGACLAASAQVSVDSTKTGAAAPFAGTFAWADRPTCSTGLSGATARISDVGIAPGIRIVCDGTNWRPDGPQALARSATAVSGAVDTNENTLATITLPAGLLGTDGTVRVRTQWSYTTSANNKIIRVRFGGASGTVFSTVTATTSTYAGFDTWITNRAAANSQVGAPSTNSAFPSIGTSLTAVTSSVDTSAATTIVVSAQKGLGSETMTLERYVVEVWP